MAKEYDNTNRGVLFDNDRKESDNHPDFTGTLNVDGKEFWLSCWEKDAGKVRFSLSIKPKEPRQERERAPRAERPARTQRQAPEPQRDEPFPDDDIPF